MRNKKPLLIMENISKTFPGVVALDNVQFTLEAGSIHVLLGENGAGKSTLINVLTGVVNRDSGTVLLDGAEVFLKSPQDAQMSGISTVYQEVNLCPNISVAENIYIGRAPGNKLKIDWKTMNKKAQELLKRFDLNINVTASLDTYSIAVQQMVAIARAVDISAKVLVLDEPTSSLSVVEVKRLFEIMRRLKNQGIGIIFVTHFLDQVYEVSDTITVLRDGKYVGTYVTEELPRVQLIAKMIGKEYDDLQGHIESKTVGVQHDPLLTLSASTSAPLPNPLNMDVRKGEILGLSGLLGSGRSEIVRMIFGIDKMSGGKLQLSDREIKIKDTVDAMRAGFAFCPENRNTEGIIGNLSVRENIILALQVKRGMFHKTSRAEAEKIADTYIKELSIKTPSKEQLVKNLSGGNQQKVIFARWLATNPLLLMLDEPTKGIDIGTKAEIQKIVVTLARHGMAIIFISSEIDEMLRCCERIIVLRDKDVVAELNSTFINEKVIMDYIAGGDRHENTIETVS